MSDNNTPSFFESLKNIKDMISGNIGNLDPSLIERAKNAASEDFNIPTLSEIKDRKGEAILKTAQNTSDISNELKKTNLSIEKEAEDRKVADKENRAYTDKWNRITFTVSIVAILIALASLFK